AVPGLLAHEADVPQLVGLVVAEQAVDFVESGVGWRPGEMGVVEADHVVGKRDHALAGEADAAGGDAAVFGVGHPAFLPMAMRVEEAGQGPLAPAPRAIQIAREIKTGEGLKIHLLDDVAVALDFAADARLNGSLSRHGPLA